MSTEPRELNVDVVIVGGGIMGAATAWHLTRGGARVALCEALEPGHSLGSSHGDGRIARFTYSEPEYLQLAQRSFEQWRQVEKIAKVSLLETTGSWECGLDSSEELTELIEALELHGIRHEVWDAAESNRRFAHFNLPRTSRAVYQPDGAVVRADRSWRCFWNLAAIAGAQMLTGAPVLEIEVDAAGITVHVDPAAASPGQTPRKTSGRDSAKVAGKITVRADAAVITAGAWARRILSSTGLDLPLTVSRETVAYFQPAPNATTLMADHRVGAMPTLIDYHQNPPFYALPILDDTAGDYPPGDLAGVKVGWHHAGKTIEPTTIPTRFGAGHADPVIVGRIVGYVGDRFPYLEMRPIMTLSCLYTNTPDYHFVLGRHPRHANLVFGAGFSGHGFKFAPAVGEILASLITQSDSNQDPNLDLRLFRPERFTEGPSRKRRIA